MPSLFPSGDPKVPLPLAQRHQVASFGMLPNRSKLLGPFSRLVRKGAEPRMLVSQTKAVLPVPWKDFGASASISPNQSTTRIVEAGRWCPFKISAASVTARLQTLFVAPCSLAPQHSGLLHCTATVPSQPPQTRTRRLLLQVATHPRHAI